MSLLSCPHHSLRPLVIIFSTWEKENTPLFRSLQVFYVLLRDVISLRGSCIQTEHQEFIQTTFKGQLDI